MKNFCSLENGLSEYRNLAILSLPINSYILYKNMVRFSILLGFILGLYTSLLVVFHTFPVEADFSDTAMLWFGFHQYGWKFFSSWLYTYDNWLLSLTPLHFLFFWLLGPQPIIVLMTGWAIFIASLLVIGLIAKTQGATKTAIFLPLTLLFAGQFAHAIGYLTYSISHNVTNLYGLICLFLTLCWLRYPHWLILLGIFITGLVSGVSDPWMLGAYLFPMLLASFLFFILYRHSPTKYHFLSLFFVLLLVIAGSKSRCFELLHFLPIYHYQSETPQLLQNFIGFISNTGQLMNIVPVPYYSLFLSPFISAFIFIALFIYSVFSAYQFVSLKNQFALQYFFMVALFSMTAISVALLLNHSITAKDSRFMLNIFYLGPLMISMVFEKSNKGLISSIMKTLLPVIAFLFIFSGIVSNVNAWKENKFILQDKNILELISFLHQHQLYYGYGPYWGSNANAVTWLSDQKIQMIPVRFSMQTGKMLTGARYQTSLYWQLPKTKQAFFVFLKKDHEECLNFKLCIQGVEQQFGLPSKVLSYQ
ncbi:MAG: hypothetical protein JO149_01285, partial [Gammaproteobacteria bacterium]|nr:hypothetical protein [Gammaproteobacteria bacterium]